MKNNWGSYLPAYEDGTDRVFPNVGIQNSDARELPRRKHTTFRTWHKFEIKNITFTFTFICKRGPGSSVGIATGYGLDGPGIKSRWRVRFSAPVQNGPGAHPASCTMGTESFLGVKSSWGMTLTPHPLLLLWSRKGRAIPLVPLWAVRPVQSLSACTRVTFTFYFICKLFCQKFLKCKSTKSCQPQPLVLQQE